MSNNATIALATGGSRGLGHSTVEALARRASTFATQYGGNGHF